MKKSFIVIALVLLMAGSLFAEKLTPTAEGSAAASASVNTTVELVLKKTPTYIFGITSTEFKSTDIKTDNVPTTTMTHSTKIELKRNSAKVLDVDSVSTYYLSYLFYEYDAVTVSMTLSGNLTTTATTTTTDEKEIKYYVTVGGESNSEYNQDGTATTIDQKKLDSAATSTDGKTWSKSYTKTEKLGQYVWTSLQLTVAPQTTTNTLKGKVAGTYTSTITLSVTAS